MHIHNTVLVKIFAPLAFLLLVSFGQPVQSQSILIDPNVKYQEVEGWGGSLCWWANIIGGYDDIDILKVCDWITDPNGLNMNVFRFNIGGGDDPTHNHMRPDGGDMPGYKPIADGPYDWSQDENQRKIVQQLIASRIAQTGENDIILEAFSNSPPYWMTISGCSSGNFQGHLSNLRDDMYEEFADYLTEVAKYYHDSLGITFRTLEPFNEPYSTWWTAFGGQEGCHFGQADQERLIRKVYAKLEEKDMLGYTTISAMDPSSLDEGYNGFVAYNQAGDILPKLSQLNVHSYFGSGGSRRNIARFAHEHNMRLWQSESGPLNISGTDQELFLIMSARIIRDMRELKPVAWIDWQLAANQSPVWGLIVGDYFGTFNTLSRGDGYYYRSQFSRFIKPGYTIIDAKSPDILTALSPDEMELIIVVVNETTSSRDHTFKLDAFNEITGNISRYRTREVNPQYTERLTRTTFTADDLYIDYTAPAMSVTTFVVPVSISDNRINNNTWQIKNKDNGHYIGINNASINNGGRLVTIGEQPDESSSFVVSQDVLLGGFRARPGHTDSESGLVLDVEGNSYNDGARIIQFQDNNSENQRFHFIHIEDNYYNIMARHSQKCLYITENSNEPGVQVRQMTCGETDNFVWEIKNQSTSVPDNISNSKNQFSVNYQDGTLTVFLDKQAKKYTLEVISMTGVIIHKLTIEEQRNYSAQVNLDSGFYILRIIFPNGKTQSKIFTAL